MKIKLELNEEEIHYLKCAIDIAYFKCNDFLLNDYVSDEKKDEIKKDKNFYTCLLNKINEQQRNSNIKLKW